MPSIAKFIDRMHYYCSVASVGYDWARRWDVYDGGDTDCSALVITCLREAGFDTGNATYTGNMSSELCARGWERLAPDLSTARPGDILLNDANHVAAVLYGYGWDATIGQASIGETGGVYGNQPGDQTGWETNETLIYDYPWDCILRWTGEHDESEDDVTMGALDEAYTSPSGDETTGSVKERVAYTDMRVRELVEPHESAAGDGNKDGIRDQVDYIDKRVADIDSKVGEILKLLKAKK